MLVMRLVAGLIPVAGAAVAQDAGVTSPVDGALLEHGGVVERFATADPDASAVPQTITLTDRYAQVKLRHLPEASDAFRFKPAPGTALHPDTTQFQTELLSVGGQSVDGPDGRWAGAATSGGLAGGAGAVLCRIWRP